MRVPSSVIKRLSAFINTNILSRIVSELDDTEQTMTTNEAETKPEIMDHIYYMMEVIQSVDKTLATIEYKLIGIDDKRKDNTIVKVSYRSVEIDEEIEENMADLANTFVGKLVHYKNDTIVQRTLTFKFNTARNARYFKERVYALIPLEKQVE